MYIKDIPKKASIDTLLNILPKKTYNCEPFGLMLMSTNEGWSCCYYTHYSNKTDDRFPTCVGKTPQIALKRMIKTIIRKGYKTILTKI